MRKLVTILVAVILSANVWAQSPEKMSYQAVIRNNSGALVDSTTVGMKLSILQGTPTGTVVYTETLTPFTNANGLVSIEFGGGIGFDTINWASGPYFIKTETDPLGGTAYTINGTSQLLSVPYALHAKNGVVAYGNISSTGVKNSGSNNYTVSKTTTGIYNITWTDGLNTHYAAGIVNISTTTGNARITAWTSTGGGTILRVKIYDNIGTLVDDAFCFTVFNH